MLFEVQDPAMVSLATVSKQEPELVTFQNLFYFYAPASID